MRGLFDPGIGVDHFHSNPPSVGACASLFPCATYCMALSFLTIYRPAGWLYYKLCRIYDMDTASPPATELWLDHHQFLSDYYTLVSSFLSVVGLYFYTSQHDGSLFFHTTVGQSFISDFFFFFHWFVSAVCWFCSLLLSLSRLSTSLQPIPRRSIIFSRNCTSIIIIRHWNDRLKVLYEWLDTGRRLPVCTASISLGTNLWCQWPKRGERGLNTL